MNFQIGETVYLLRNNDLPSRIIIVMTGEQGIRYIDPDNLMFDDEGKLYTQYVDIKTLMDCFKNTDLEKGKSV